MSLYMEDDFALNPAGTFRAPSDVESIRQDVGHLVDDLGLLGEPATTSTAGTLRGAIVKLLTTHPSVTSLDAVTVTPDPNGANTLSISVFVNGNPAPITKTISTR